MSSDLSTNTVQHLGMIQGVITRMADNSFSVRRWSIATTAALVGVAIAQEEAALAFVALVPVLAYWLLDTYYLRQERLFRALYDKVRRTPDEVEPFAFQAGLKPDSFRDVLLSITELLTHLPLVAAALVIAVVLL